MLVATVIASNYLAHLRVLERSLHRVHPDARLVALVVDAPCEDAVDGVELLVPADVGMDAAELHRRALLYDVQGVVSSLRWWLLRTLLADAPVLLLDADMLVLGPLDDVAELAAGTGVLLSPHALTPLDGRPGAWREEELLRSGTFSGGFVGIGAAAGPFLDWIAERTAMDCLRSPQRGLLYGQTWLNLVPALFEHRVLRDEGVNTQVHVLADRDVTFDGEAVRVDATAVRLFHFAGFDPARPDRLCARDDPGTSLDGLPGLARLCREYAAALVAAGRHSDPGVPWSTLPDGTPVDPVMRSALRAALLAGERPPDPFDADGAFLAWLRAPAPGAVVSRYLLELHRARGDLRAAFPSVSLGDADAYVAWAAGKAREAGQADVPVALVPTLSPAPPAAPAPPARDRTP